jgi:hypothetical protein
MSGTGGVVGSGGLAWIGTGGSPPSSDAATRCFSLDVQAEGIPFDMYVMFDQSQSMSAMVPNSNPPTTWWASAQAAFTSFAQDPAAAGTGVGLQFFPYGGSIAPNSCNVDSYATPEVEVGLLPGNAAALVAAVQRHAPTTFTPTAAALQGAINHMKQWGPAHPGRQPVVVLLTDGYPTECDPQDPSLIAQIAKRAYDELPRVLTYIVGFESGGGLDNMGLISRAGGGGEPILISGGDIRQQFVQAMLAMMRAKLPCEFDIPSTGPAGQPVDVSRIWMRYASITSTTPVVIAHVADAGACGATGGGWYFDSSSAPTKMIACPQTCSAYAGGIVIMDFGCRPTTP